MNRIEIIFGDDCVGCAFYEDEKQIMWEKMSRQDQLRTIVSLAKFCEMFYPRVKEEQHGN